MIIKFKVNGKLNQKWQLVSFLKILMKYVLWIEKVITCKL